ncbi:primosomal protein DnaI [Paenibacillus farraposensis]|uniref:Primosomal protein DnaI n=1 Tax=Paenibacillus farraposensis TaxID=2807095 RepID=A0ABW4DDP3_9BACL|nr:primosomal protein DnaI [Paenibacillus farraposensis]MCC3380728.1 primosomal protein DnaI [Paenibacillus farraposensis]
MESFRQELKALIPSRFFERQAEIIQRIDNHPEVQRLRKEYPDRTADLTSPRHYRDISQHLSYCDACNACPGLNACQNEQKGHRSVEEPNPTQLDELVFRLRKCNLLKAYEKQQGIGQRIKSHYIPSHILDATFDDIEPDPQRLAAITAAVKFCSTFVPGETTEGLYLYGPMGVGKSRIAGAIAQELAKCDVDVLMVYVPDFLLEVKDAIGSKTETVENKLDSLRTASVLILDDIGAETLTVWTRDEVIGPILQRRMERLPIIYTSNLTINELRHHLANVKDAKEMDRKQHEKKAERIIERIEPFVKILPVGGRNRRRD